MIRVPPSSLTLALLGTLVATGCSNPAPADVAAPTAPATDATASAHPDVFRFRIGALEAAALKDGRRRDLTQAVATYLHHDARRLAGVVFESRHGDELTLWAVFERPHDPNVSPHLSEIERELISPTHPDVVDAFATLGLTWGPVGS